MTPCPDFCACQYVVYGGNSPNRCLEAFDDERGTARCHLGRGHHKGHQIMHSVLYFDRVVSGEDGLSAT